MIDFIIGLAVGTAFAPFWMTIYNKFIKPAIAKVVTKK